MKNLAFRQRVRFIVFALTGLYAVVMIGIILSVWLPPYVRSLRQVTVQYFRVPTPHAQSVSDRRWLDGIATATSTVNPPLVGVMIENHIDARPLSGLSQARVVYELPVEGNITRFLALYPLAELPERVGPVRSVRSYALKVLNEWGTPLVAHVGGSPDALAIIKRGGFNDFDEYFNGRYFWRDDKRRSPHNVYTSGELITSAKRATSTEFSPWIFEQESVTSTAARDTEGAELNLVYAAPWHAVSWAYDETDDVYYRLQAGKFHRGEDGEKISASTVVVQRVTGGVVDDIGRLELTLQGEGDAFILKHGERTTSTWKRALGETRTRFYDALGKEIPFAPGRVWLQVVMPWHDVW